MFAGVMALEGRAILHDSCQKLYYVHNVKWYDDLENVSNVAVVQPNPVISLRD